MISVSTSNENELIKVMVCTTFEKMSKQININLPANQLKHSRAK